MATVTTLTESPFLKEGEPFTKDKLIEFIKERESFRPEAYWDVDHWTIGYGTKGKKGEVISKKVAEQRLLDDIDTREKFVRNYAKQKGYDWNDSQVNSLVDFHFNTKQPNFLALTGKGTRSNDEIAEKMLEYNTVEGKHNQGIQNRRFQNYLAFTTPTKTDSLQNFAEGKVEEPKPTPTIAQPEVVVAAAKQNPATSVTQEDQSVFTKTPPIQVAANTPTNVASDVPTPVVDTTNKIQVPQSISQKFGYDPNKFKFNQPQQVTETNKQEPQTPFNTKFNDEVLTTLKDKHYNTAVDLAKGFDNLVKNKQLPNTELNDRVLKSLLASDRKDLAQQYANYLDVLRPQLYPQQQPAQPETKPVEPVKEQGALRVLGQTALKEVIPTGIGYGVSELVGAALAPETGGASLALVPLLVNLGARITSFVGAHAGGSALQKNVLPEAINKTLEQGEAQHPTAAMVGGFLPFGLYGGFGLSSAARKEIGEAFNLAKTGDYTKVKSLKTYSEPLVQAGFGAGIEGISQAVQGEFDPSRILISGMMMPLVSGDKTRLGKALTFENVGLKTKESAEDIIKNLKGKEFFVPRRVDDIPIINLEKETKGEYAARHGITEAEVDTHKANEDSVRIKEINKVPTIEVDVPAVKDEFAKKLWTKLYNLPEATFKDFQSYLDFKIQRTKVEHQEPETAFNDKNSQAQFLAEEASHNRRQEYYGLIKQYEDDLDLLHEQLSVADPKDQQAILKEIKTTELELENFKKNEAPPEAVISHKEFLTSEDTHNVMAGAKTIGEALDRLVEGSLGNPVERALFKLLRSNKYISDIPLDLKPHLEVMDKDGYLIPGAYTRQKVSEGLFDKGVLELNQHANLHTIGHEAIHAATLNAMDRDPEFAKQMDDFFERLKATAKEDELWENKGWYGLADAKEMISEAFSNTEFQRWLSDRPPLLETKAKSAWQEFKDIIKDYLGTPKTENALDQLIDLTHENLSKDAEFSNFSRKGEASTLKFKENSYQAYLNESAMEQASINPFFNLDALGLPPMPTNEKELADGAFISANARMIDTIRGTKLYDLAVKEGLTPELQNNIRLHLEGINQNSEALEVQVRDVDATLKSLKSAIDDLKAQGKAIYENNDFQFGTPKRNKYQEIVDKLANKEKLTDDERRFYDNIVSTINKPYRDLRERWEQLESELPEKQKVLKAERDRLTKEIETPTPLNAEEQRIYDKYYKPLIDELTKAYDYLKRINPELANQLGEMRNGKFFFNRQMNPLTLEQIRTMQANGTIENPNFFGKIKNAFAEIGGKLEGGFDPNLGKLSSASKTRSFWVLKERNGDRSVIQIGKDGKIFKWDNQKAKLIGKMPQREQLLKEGDTFFGGQLAQGSIKEIEQHAPVSYNRNSLAVLIEKMNQAREEVRQDAYLKELMASPMMKDIALPTHVNDKLQDIPEGYAVPKNVQKYPPLAGYMFPVRVANIINDFAKVWEPTVLTNLTNIIVKNMMVNPIAHMLNEAFHLFNARGLSGWVTPGGLARFHKFGKEAINDVVNLSDFYEETIRLGGALLSPGTRDTAFQTALFGKGLHEFSATGEFKELANDLGVSLKQLYNGISKQSNRAMWITRDVMYMQYLREVMETKGLTHPQAIAYAERHMPNYRLPSMIGEKVVGENIGRGLSYIMQNPNISVFSRYHYGMVKSLVNMVQEVGAIKKGAAGMKEFRQGVDSAAAVAVALAVMYPLMDMMAKSLTDNDKAKFRRAGPYHLIHAMEDVTSGAKSPAAAMNSVFTFNPALSGLAQFAMNTNWYSGQPIYNPQSDPLTLASDIARYAGMQLPMASQALRAETDKSGQGYAAMGARQIDIEAPTPAQYVSTEKRKREAAKDSLRRRLERQLRGF